MSFFPVIELFDRLCIARLKWEKTQANQEELEFYEQQVQQYDLALVNDKIHQLTQIHTDIWQLESALKSGLEQQLSLEEIGRRAIAIRNLNNQRIKIKNEMAQLFNDPVREIKHQHLSE